jgi:hypothetical protein
MRCNFDFLICRQLKSVCFDRRCQSIIRIEFTQEVEKDKDEKWQFQDFNLRSLVLISRLQAKDSFEMLSGEHLVDGQKPAFGHPKSLASTKTLAATDMQSTIGCNSDEN